MQPVARLDYEVSNCLVTITNYKNIDTKHLKCIFRCLLLEVGL